MDSYFNNVLQLFILIWTTVAFIRQFIQFKFGSGPLDLTRNLVSLSLLIWLIFEFSVSANLVSFYFHFNWSRIPLVILGVGLLLECLVFIGDLSSVQVKVLSRVPVLVALISLTVFPTRSLLIFSLSVLVGLVLMLIAFNRSRFEARIYLKMTFFLGLAFMVNQIHFSFNEHLKWISIFFSILYFYKFQNAMGVKGLIKKELNS